MKIAIIYNYDSKAVINLFGAPNRERYGLKTIMLIASALKAGGHQVKSFEGDKNIIENLEDFMPTVIAGERPGLVFNLSYGVQGKARYTHIPAILEMLGVPYIGSSPDVHGIALDKVVTKMILRQRGLPTPNFDVLDQPDSPIADDLRYPLIVKPRSEAVSFGLKIVHDEKEMRDGVATIYEEFKQPTLVEEFIEGREFNVGLLGNGPPDALPVLEMDFCGGEAIYTYEDKTRKSGREISKICPAQLDEEQTRRISDIAVRSFQALGCQDCARVDLRMDEEGNFYVLEINSMASLGRGGSFVHAAAVIGLDYAALANRLVEVASQRYFGTEIADLVEKQKSRKERSVFSYLINKRDSLERDLESWAGITSRTEDAGHLSAAVKLLEDRLARLGLEAVPEFSNQRSAWTWQTPAGLAGGTLIVLNLDNPAHPGQPSIPFRRGPEWFHGEAVATSRAGIVCTLAALGALRSVRRLKKKPIGLFAYTDEGRGMRYSGEVLKAVSAQAGEVLVMRPGAFGGKVITQRRGFRKYSISIEGRAVRAEPKKTEADAMTWFLGKSAEIIAMSRPAKRLTVAVQNVRADHYSVLMPHRLEVVVTVSFLYQNMADAADAALRKIFTPDLKKKGPRARIELLEERPPLRAKKANPVVARLAAIGEEWKLPFATDSSAAPSAAGLVSGKIPVVCGFAPAGRDIFTPLEAVKRGELLPRVLLLALFLDGNGNGT